MSTDQLINVLFVLTALLFLMHAVPFILFLGRNILPIISFFQNTVVALIQMRSFHRNKITTIHEDLKAILSAAGQKSWEQDLSAIHYSQQ